MMDLGAAAGAVPRGGTVFDDEIPGKGSLEGRLVNKGGTMRASHLWPAVAVGAWL